VFPDLESAVATIPVGRYVVGVSGGADSVALLRLLHRYRPGLAAHVAHLDHEWRGPASALDAAFVASLAGALKIPVTTFRRGEIERQMTGAPSPNREARGRAARFAMFRTIVGRHGLDGVLLAHHRDDQAETVLLRLARGGDECTLGGIRSTITIDGLVIRRPLLGVPRVRLTQWLGSIGQSYRDDASNADPAFARNRARALLARQRQLVDPLVDLGASMREWQYWMDTIAPRLAAEFAAVELSRLPFALARHSATRWLVAHAGCAHQACDRDVVARLLAMCRDAASPARADFPGGVRVRRRGGVISVVRSDGSSPIEDSEPDRDIRRSSPDS
jgi:tRNA(Ile)-lysidine synthase